MVNEALQWVLLVVLSVFMLGMLRQLTIMLPPEHKMVPAGPSVGSRLPKQTLQAVRAALPGSTHAGQTHVAFVTETCAGCQQLIANLASFSKDSRVENVVLIAKRPSEQFQRALLASGIPTVIDQDSLHWQECSVTATPLLVSLDEGGKILRREVAYDVDDLATAHPAGPSSTIGG